MAIEEKYFESKEYPIRTHILIVLSIGMLGALVLFDGSNGSDILFSMIIVLSAHMLILWSEYRQKRQEVSVSGSKIKIINFHTRKVQSIQRNEITKTEVFVSLKSFWSEEGIEIRTKDSSFRIYKLLLLEYDELKTLLMQDRGTH